MPYPTTAELVAESAREDLLALDGVQQEALRVAAIGQVEKACRQRFIRFDATFTIDGTGDGILWLPHRLLELAALTVGAGTPIEVPGNIDLDVSDPTKNALRWMAPSTSYADVATREPGWEASRVWRHDRRYTISGAWGWDEVPADVVTAIRLDMEDQASVEASGLVGTVAMARILGVKDHSQGNLRLTLTGQPHGLSPRAIKALLPSSVWSGPPGYVV